MKASLSPVMSVSGGTPGLQWRMNWVQASNDCVVLLCCYYYAKIQQEKEVKVRTSSIVRDLSSSLTHSSTTQSNDMGFCRSKQDIISSRECERREDKWMGGPGVQGKESGMVTIKAAGCWNDMR